MNGAELFRLGRRLIKLGVASMPPSYFSELPHGVRLVLLDVFENPGSTIGQIVNRTGFPQSHVSSSVARLRELGVLDTEVDTNDRRRTLVVPSSEHIAEIRRAQGRLDPVDPTIEATLVERFGPSAAGRTGEVVNALELLSHLLAERLEPAPQNSVAAS